MAKSKKNGKKRSKLENGQYYPELAMWFPPACQPKGPGVCELRENRTGDKSDCTPGQLLATIHINLELLDERSGANLARLVGCAPEMWRLLRDITPWIEFHEDVGLNMMAHDATDLLHEAADRMPYEPRIPCDDENISAGNMKRAGFVVEPTLLKNEIGGGP